MQKTLTQTSLSSTEKALMAYLDDMLAESTLAASAPESEAPVVPPAAVAVEPVIEPVVPEVVAVPVVAPSPPPVVVPELVAAASLVIPAPHTSSLPMGAPAVITRLNKEDESVDAVPTLPGLPDWLDKGRPQWADAPFEALMFKVGGLKMAVPLVSLGLIHPIEKRFNELPRQNPWFLGMLRTSSATIKVIDTAMCVMPERYDPSMRDSLKFVITLHGYEWGLAAHEVDKAIQLDPSKIQWRTKRGKRPWLAGTVVDHMCALIDSEGFHQVIAAAEGSVS